MSRHHATGARRRELLSSRVIDSVQLGELLGVGASCLFQMRRGISGPRLPEPLYSGRVNLWLTADVIKFLSDNPRYGTHRLTDCL